jgi:hypothetical protein
VPQIRDQDYRIFTAPAEDAAKRIERTAAVDTLRPTAPAASPRPVSPSVAPSPGTGTPGADRISRLRDAAQSLEASFLAEMLKAAGFGKPLGAFGGGTGEEQFSSLLVQEQARVLAAAGGIGLSEHIFRSLLERENASA